MDRQKCAKVSEEIQSAIADVLARHGLDLQSMRGSYTDSDVSFKLALVEQADSSLGYNPNTREAKLYVEAAALYELPPIGTVVTLGGADYRICGWNNRARTKPVLAIRVSDGGTVKIAEDAVRRAAGIVRQHGTLTEVERP